MQKSVKRFKKSKIPHRWYGEVSVGVVPLISQGQERKQLQVSRICEIKSDIDKELNEHVRAESIQRIKLAI